MEPRKWQENDWQYCQQHTHLHFYLCEGKHLEAFIAASTTLIDCHTNLRTRKHCWAQENICVQERTDLEVSHFLLCFAVHVC